jgi:hypothetical protein
VVSGTGKLPGLKAALRGGFINELIIDEPARACWSSRSAAAQRPDVLHPSLRGTPHGSHLLAGV